MNNIAVGIDLGTSTSEVTVYINNETNTLRDPIARSPIIPSVVAIDKKNRIVVGDQAMRYVGSKKRFCQEVKRSMGKKETIKLGDRDFKPEEISAIILKKIKELVESVYSTKIDEAVITVPANFPEPARKATLLAAELAGIKVLRLINEPTAAALAYGIKKFNTTEDLLIFDWGGGTLDVSILEMIDNQMNVIASFGNPNLGGKDIDDLFAQKLHDEFIRLNGECTIIASAALKQEVKRGKEILSSQEEIEIYVPSYAINKEGEDIDLDTIITREEFQKIIKPLVLEAKDVVVEALATKAIRVEKINKVLAIGGTSYIPYVREMLDSVFHNKVSFDVDPDLAVSIGASLQAAYIKGLINKNEAINIKDVSPYGLGVPVLESMGRQIMAFYDPLIEPNTSLPYSVSKTYNLITSDQKNVEIKVLQSHYSGSQLLSNVIDTGIMGKIKSIPTSKTGEPHPFKINFIYDNNGMIKLSAYIPTTNQKLDIKFNDSEISMSEEEKKIAIERIEDMWMKNNLLNYYTKIIHNIQKYINNNELNDEEVTQLQKLKDQIERSLNTGNRYLAEEAEKELKKYGIGN